MFIEPDGNPPVIAYEDLAAHRSRTARAEAQIDLYHYWQKQGLIRLMNNRDGSTDALTLGILIEGA